MSTPDNIVLKNQFGEESINELIGPIKLPSGNYIYYGSGAPSFNAPAGSTYFRADPTGPETVIYINPTPGNSWQVLPTGGAGSVLTVNEIGPDGDGNVELTKSDIGLGNVANLAPADLPISDDTQEALDTIDAVQDGLLTDVNALETDMTAAQAAITALQSAVSTLQSQMTTANSNISTLQAQAAKFRTFITTQDYSNTGNTLTATTVTQWTFSVAASKSYFIIFMPRLHTAAAATASITHRPDYPTGAVANYGTVTGAQVSNQNILSQPPANGTSLGNSVTANNSDYAPGLCFCSFTNGVNAGNFTYKFLGPNNANVMQLLTGSMAIVIEM